MKDYRQLEVWQFAHQLALDTYRATSSFPKSEMFGLTSQLRRAAVSVAANIAEGCGRDGAADFARFLQMAYASANETRYLFEPSHELRFITQDDYTALEKKAQSVQKMTAALIRRLKGRP